MNRAKLNLLACPALLASMLLVANPTHAAEVVAQPPETVESTPATPMFEVVFEQKTTKSPMQESTDKEANAAIERYGCNCSGESPMLEFTDEESNAAIASYGCDCSSCLNAVRQLQGKLPLL